MNLVTVVLAWLGQAKSRLFAPGKNADGIHSVSFLAGRIQDRRNAAANSHAKSKEDRTSREPLDPFHFDLDLGFSPRLVRCLHAGQFRRPADFGGLHPKPRGTATLLSWGLLI